MNPVISNTSIGEGKKYLKLLNHWYFLLASDVAPWLWQKVIKVVRLVLLAVSHMLRPEPMRRQYEAYWPIRTRYVLPPAGTRTFRSRLYFTNIMLLSTFTARITTMEVILMTLSHSEIAEMESEMRDWFKYSANWSKVF